MHHTQALCRFLAELTYAQLPEHVLARTEELYLGLARIRLGQPGRAPDSPV